MEVLTLTFQAEDTPADAIFAYPLDRYRFDPPFSTEWRCSRRCRTHVTDVECGMGCRCCWASPIAAVIAGARSFAAIGEWVADQPPGALAQLGVDDTARPEESAIRRLFARLDAEILDRGKRGVDVHPHPPGRGQGSHRR